MNRRGSMEKEIMIKINNDSLDETLEKTKRLVELLKEVEQIIESLFQNNNQKPSCLDTY